MELGIAGRWAVVCAASKGLGKGCARALAMEGVNLVINARSKEALDATAQELRELDADIEVHAVAGDIGSEAVRTAVLSACPRVDILINNNGGPPPGDFRDWSRNDWHAAVEANMITPIELIKATVDRMAVNGFGRVVNITSGAVKAPIDILGLSNGARSGLTGFVAGLARQPQLAGNNVTINNLLPGAFDTERLQSTLKSTAKNTNQDLEQVREERAQGIPARRFGSADEFGAFCAFLCSIHAGYLTGQNILLDGGSYPGTF
ncbi:3-oxoacyl-ACP reductase [Litchfieldella anticariensis FP35 = DSM 16096]|uniref:3-oxoacyl-ACP reductase n=1 Tax=Litchfieldella anticariensis (strain DSM 16096 / CECT 5854 / CIP 108499 / LMG 22089 / FP35) TaxID=1121939 RepID=S2KYX2_LITA3|nr:SDR family oxidoreductase [Halomonas anticariensis]EPC00609.1 3-oxoacyl-ACP reductase [Halomonas anticariensis FP35 = DSM 16096]